MRVKSSLISIKTPNILNKLTNFISFMIFEWMNSTVCWLDFRRCWLQLCQVQKTVLIYFHQRMSAPHLTPRGQNQFWGFILKGDWLLNGKMLSGGMQMNRWFWGSSERVTRGWKNFVTSFHGVSQQLSGENDWKSIFCCVTSICKLHCWEFLV